MVVHAIFSQKSVRCSRFVLSTLRDIIIRQIVTRVSTIRNSVIQALCGSVACEYGCVVN